MYVISIHVYIIYIVYIYIYIYMFPLFVYDVSCLSFYISVVCKE